MTPASVGRRVARLRQARGWTQAELADLVGVNEKTVRNWESDATSPRNKLGALETVFGVDLETGEVRQDAVVSAIERSDLSRADRAELVSHYWRLVDARPVVAETTEPRNGSRGGTSAG